MIGNNRFNQFSKLLNGYIYFNSSNVLANSPKTNNKNCFNLKIAKLKKEKNKKY